MTKIAVIGAGLSGLVVARKLQSCADVIVFEKSRGPGGRLATCDAGDFEFDHGTQFFTARSEFFRSFLQPLIDVQVVADWPARFAELDRASITDLRSWGPDYPHLVGVPRMDSVARHLSANLHIVRETAIMSIARIRKGWTMQDAAGEQFGPFNWLVLTTPASQTAALAAAVPELVEYCGERHMLGCFALMLGFSGPVELAWQAALVRNADISWISVNSSKPARDKPFTLVVLSTNAWADENIDKDRNAVLGHLLDEACSITGKDLNGAAHRELHRWRYANIARQPGPAYFLDRERQLAACGDWCVRGRVEAAFSSASDLADQLLAVVKPC